MAKNESKSTKPKKATTGPSIGVGHDDWASMNPGMKPKDKEAKPKAPAKKG